MKSNNKAAENESQQNKNQNQNRLCQLSLKAKIIISVTAALLVIIALSIGIGVGISQNRGSKSEKSEDVPQEQQQSVEDIVQEIQEEFQNLAPNQIIPRPISPLPRPVIVSPPQVIVTPPSSPQSSGLDPGSNAWLTAHNDRRAQHCDTPPLRWNPALVKSAQAWANKCEFKHSTRGGENLYMISGGFKGVSAENVLYQFYDNEITKYDFNNPDFSYETGHFTQVVWKNTEEVGCATKNCGSFALVVCHYDPSGNILGRFGQQVGNVCK